MTELVEWLRAQLDEDERVAREATPGPWWWGQPTPGRKAGSTLRGAAHPVSQQLQEVLATTVHDLDRRDAEHIAAHDPARVLAEVAAKRAILDRLAKAEVLYQRGVEETLAWAEGRARKPRWNDPQPPRDPDLVTAGEPLDLLRWTVHVVATAYADRPGYDKSWRP